MHSTVRAWAFPTVVALAFALGLAGGCSKPAARSAEREATAAPEESREAETTRDLETKAAEYKDRFEEIRQSDMSADEKAQAVSELVDEQQRTVREAEDGDSGEAGSQQ